MWLLIMVSSGARKITNWRIRFKDTELFEEIDLGSMLNPII